MNFSDQSIRYEDNHLLVVVKPPGMLTQGDDSGRAALNERLKQYLKQRYSKPGNVFLGMVHRLDQPVGGVMVFAKTSKAAGRLSEQIRSRTFDKQYLTVVAGTLDAERRFVHFLRKDKGRNLVSVVSKDRPGAKQAVLTVQPLQCRGQSTLVRVHLLTGRPHQIRVQLAAEGYPLLGDRKYGSARGAGGCDLALWSYSLSFIHPTLRTPLTFTVAPPMTRQPWQRFSALGSLDSAQESAGKSDRDDPNAAGT